jgi:hypothetical protein
MSHGGDLQETAARRKRLRAAALTERFFVELQQGQR